MQSIIDFFLETLNNTTIQSLLALPFIIGANMGLGVALSKLEYRFDIDVFKRGLFKGVIIYSAIALLSIALLVRADITVEFDGAIISMADAIDKTLFGFVLYYAGQAIIKLGKTMGVHSEDIQKEGIPEANYTDVDGLG